MSISNPKIIDAAAVKDGQLVMLISDHLRWDDLQTAHLKMLQDKMNTYIRYFENKTYKKDFPDEEVTSAVIDIVFLHPYDLGFERMIALKKGELDKRKITVKYRVAS